MKTPERSVEEIVEEYMDFPQEDDNEWVYLYTKDIIQYPTPLEVKTMMQKALQAERQRCEEMVEAERELPEKWKGKIICGFAGIGKSTLAKKYANVVDLESMPFEKDWDRYAKVARHMAKNGYTVLLSCHKEIREKLHNGYFVAKPRQLARIEYINRYKARGNDEAFVTMMNQNWEKFIELLPHESEYILIENNLEYTLTQLPITLTNDKE